MNILDINPFIRFAPSHPSVFEGGCLRSAYDCKIFYAISGEGKLHIKDETVEFKTGSLCFMPFDYPYYFEEQIYIIVLNFDFTREFYHITEPAMPVPQDEFCSDKIH